MSLSKFLLLTVALYGGSTIGKDSYTSTPHITIHDGETLKGTSCSNTDVDKFLGIPYAQAPLGSLRFLPPKKLGRHSSSNKKVLDATHPAAPCIQYNQQFGVFDPTPSEDW